MVEGDKNKLSQVVRNLVSNALKFTPPGGAVTVRASTYRVQTTRSGRSMMMSLRTPASVGLEHTWVRVEVKDTGAGISKVQSGN